MIAPHAIAIGGIDTDVGKSYVTGLFARFLLQGGHQVTTLKLVQTGCRAMSDDILFHRKLMGQELSETDRDRTSCPYLFAFPGSPLLAARMEGQRIEAGVLDRSLGTLQQRYDWVLVEGAGGLLVPLNDDLVLLDYFSERKLPLLLVCTPRLGSINHIRLSLEAVRARKMRLLGLVYNLHGDHASEIVRDTLQECRKALAYYGFTDRLVIVPQASESTAVAWQILLQAADQAEKNEDEKDLAA